MKTNFFIYFILLLAYLVFVQTAKAEDIHFNNDIYQLKVSQAIELDKGYENEYFPTNETKDNWTKMIGIYYYPEVNNPIKFANQKDEEMG